MDVLFDDEPMVEPEGGYKKITRDDLKPKKLDAKGPKTKIVTDDALTQAKREAWRQSAMWYFVAHTKRVRGMHWKELNVIINACDRVADQEPLWLDSEPKYSVEGYMPELGLMSGASITGLMIACIWVKCGENPVTASGLISAWPDVPQYAVLSGTPLENIYPKLQPDASGDESEERSIREEASKCQQAESSSDSA